MEKDIKIPTLKEFYTNVRKMREENPHLVGNSKWQAIFGSREYLMLRTIFVQRARMMVLTVAIPLMLFSAVMREIAPVSGQVPLSVMGLDVGPSEMALLLATLVVLGLIIAWRAGTEQGKKIIKSGEHK